MFMLQALICRYAGTDTVVYISRTLVHLPRLLCPFSPNVFSLPTHLIPPSLLFILYPTNANPHIGCSLDRQFPEIA